MEITETIARKVLEVVDAGLVRGIGSPIPGEMCVEAAVCYALGLPHGDDPVCVSRPLRQLKIRLNDSHWSSDEVRAKGLRRLAVAQLGSVGVLDEAEFVRRVVDIAIRKAIPNALRATASLREHLGHKEALLVAAAICEKEGTSEAALFARKIASDASNAATNAAYAAAYAASYVDAYAAAYADAAYAAAYATSDVAYDTAAYAATNAATNAAYAAAYAASYVDADVDAVCDKSLAEYAEDIVQILIDLKAPGCKWLALTEAA